MLLIPLIGTSILQTCLAQLKAVMLTWVGVALVTGISLLSEPLWGDSIRERRYMSLAIRDQALSVSEAKALAAGTTTLDALISDWLASAGHENRIKRYFNDQFGGGTDFVTVEDSFFLHPQEGNGALYLPDKGPCTEAVTIDDAWWLDPGETVLVCANTRSDQIYYDYDNRADADCTASGTSGIGSADCGCGPNMILCYRATDRDALRASVRYEFQERAWHAYENEMSWLELLGGNFFFGNRLLFKHYLDQQALFRHHGPSLLDLLRLSHLPLTTAAKESYPDAGAVERAGLVTSPMFSRQYNNFRSRINILTSRLLCQDVDGTLNTDNIATYVNQTLQANPDVLFEEHATNPDCAACHYPMDNMGSTLWYWNPGGWYWHWGALGSQDESGHAFGISGEGPRFLVQSFTEAAQGFHPCMARTAWQDFSGGSWNDLGNVTQAQLVQASQQGPRALIRAVLGSQEIRLLHNGGIPTTVVGGSSAYDFAATINPILKQSCSGGSCHSQGTTLGSAYEFIDNETVFKAVTASRLSDGSMPPANANLTISDENRSILSTWRAAQ